LYGGLPGGLSVVTLVIGATVAEHSGANRHIAKTKEIRENDFSDINSPPQNGVNYD
jgi:hypothetical protein